MWTLLVFGVVSFIIYPTILNILRQPYCAATPHHCVFLVFNPLDGLTLRIKIGFFGGLLFSSPVLFWQVWRFITPGLKGKERPRANDWGKIEALRPGNQLVALGRSFHHSVDRKPCEGVEHTSFTGNRLAERQ